MGVIGWKHSEAQFNGVELCKSDLPKMFAGFWHKYFKANANAFYVTKLTDGRGRDMGNKPLMHSASIDWAHSV